MSVADARGPAGEEALGAPATAAPPEPFPALERERGVRRLAAWMGVTEGQVYTLVIGLVVALVMAVIGIPPSLRDRPPTSSTAAVGSVAAPNAPITVAGTQPPSEMVAAPATMRPVLLPSRGEPPPPAATPAGPAEAPAPAPAPAGVSGPSFADGGALGTVEPVAPVGDPGAPDGIAVDPDTGRFYVATDNTGSRGARGPSKIFGYSPTGAVEHEYVIQGQPDARDHGLTGLVIDGAGHLYALDASRARVLRVDIATGAQQVFGVIPDVPACTPVQQVNCEMSPRNNPPVPKAAAFDAAGALFVADTSQGVIWKFSRVGEPSMWDVSSDYLSLRGAGPAGLQFDGAGNLVLAVTSSVVAFTGAVYIVKVEGGRAISHTEKYRARQPNDAPMGVALGASGKVYVTLAGANQVLVLRPDGAVSTSISSARFDTPNGVAFRGRSLLVTNQSSTSNNAANWTVVRVPVEEAGLPLHRPSAP